MPCIACVIDAQVGRNTVYPGAEARLGTVGLAGAINPQKHLLSQFLRHRLVVHHAKHEVDDRSPVLCEQHIEGSHVAGLQFEHNFGVGQLRVVTTACRFRPSCHRLGTVVDSVYRVRRLDVVEDLALGQSGMDGKGTHVIPNPRRAWRLRRRDRILVIFCPSIPGTDDGLTRHQTGIVAVSPQPRSPSKRYTP